VNLVALAEDVLGHLRIPVPRLVAEVDSGFQHLTHRDRHCLNSFRVGVAADRFVSESTNVHPPPAVVILYLPGVCDAAATRTPQSPQVWIGPMTATPDLFRDDASS
jgi:hypothetical protein